MRRRTLLAGGCKGWLFGALANPVAAPFATALLAGCRDEGVWPEGMLPFKWDRDTCSRCRMIISDRRFAVQIRGGPENLALKFDDIGCATTWCAEKFTIHPWLTDAGTHFWVARFGGQGEPQWLDAHQAHYLSGKTSPMGYNYAAYAEPQPGSINFAAMAQATSATWPADCVSGAASPTAGPQR